MQIRCMNCMCLTEQTQGLCPKCGQPLEVCNEPPALGVSTVLRERYLIGAVYTSNGEGYTYSAFDMIENKAVYVREFFPKGKVSRMEDGVTMSVPAAVTTSCLGWVSSFIALHQKLKSMGSTNCIAPCIDLFNANETAYAVLEAKRGKRTLQQYLDEYFDVLSWKQAEFLLTPLLYGLSGLNAAGITHCGVCPENLTVDEKGKVRLHHFTIPQARCVGAQPDAMQHELFTGYSAPEQYIAGVEGGIGEWTDVYAFCAMLYRVLTGSTVPKANSRVISDVLASPKELGADIPDAVSKAIMLGLDPNPQTRTQSFKSLLFNLYNEQATETLPKAKTLDKTIVIPAVKNPPEAKKERHMIENRKQNEPVKKPKVPVALLVLLITLPVVLGLFFMVYTLLLSEDEPSGPNISYADGVSSYLPSSNPSEEDDVSDLPSESIADGISVDNFVGKYYEDIENNAVYQTLYQISVVYEYDDTVEKGYIIEQSIAENTIVPKGEKIEFLVSKGSQYFVLPSITDGRGRRKTAEDYAAELKAAGIPSKVELRETDEYTPGKVIELSEPVGGKIDLKNPKKVTIYAAKEKVVSEGDIFGTSSEESKPDSQPDVQTETGDLEE